ncbi:MAG: hypothetical protein EOP10_08220 [Proteobacteria bacterium]|nr:MAG: hypothetical protein EOP10_08220 [Pseudomonadota bacterium]
MDAQLAGSPQEKKSRSSLQDDRVKSNFSSSDNAPALPRDPIYPNQSPSSLSGPNSEQDVGMTNLENTENFGARFQMPEASTSDNFINAPKAEGEPEASAAPQGVMDLQGTLAVVQELIERIKLNLQSAEQDELEEFLRQGSQLLTANWKTITTYSTTQVSTLKSDLKENPYKGLIAALKIGMAVSHLYTSRQTPGHFPGAGNDVV